MKFGAFLMRYISSADGLEFAVSQPHQVLFEVSMEADGEVCHAALEANLTHGEGTRLLVRDSEVYWAGGFSPVRDGPAGDRIGA